MVSNFMPAKNRQAVLWQDIPEGNEAGTRNDPFYFERLFHDLGYGNVAGADEVGRGCLAGPVIAAAVMLSHDFSLDGLTDSKKLSEKQRESLEPEIKRRALSISIASVSSDEIDRINILQASLKAMAEAVRNLSVQPQAVLIDGNQAVPLSLPQKTLIKGDSRSISIAAASVVAKVYRDRLMKKLDSKYPGYLFARHKGYATSMHLEALRKYGPCPIHRRTFRGVRELLMS